jgi:hypothetical protein
MEPDTRISVPAAAPLAVAADAHRRPRAVTFVAWLSIVEGGVAIALGGVLFGGWWLAISTVEQPDVAISLFPAALLSGSGAGLLAAAVGLLYRHPWAWTLAMAMQCLTLTVALYEYLSNDPDYVLMVLGVLAVLLLNRQEVRVAFEPGGHTHV